jgi:hypothetical protein
MTIGVLETDPKMEATGNELEAQLKNASESLVRIRAYELWQARGCPNGSDQEDWFTAEQEFTLQTV